MNVQNFNLDWSSFLFAVLFFLFRRCYFALVRFSGIENEANRSE